MNTWSPTFNQDGKSETYNEVMAEHVALMNEFKQSKLGEFEVALEKRCDELNEVYIKHGIIPEVGDVVYQVGMLLYTLQVTPDNILPRVVGKVGQ